MTWGARQGASLEADDLRLADGTWYEVKLALQCWTCIDSYFSATCIRIEKFSLQHEKRIGKRKMGYWCCSWSTALTKAIGDGHGHVCLSSPKYPDFEVSIKCAAYQVYELGTVEDHAQI